MTNPQLFLADDHQFLINGLKLALEAHGLEVIGVALSIDELLRSFPKSPTTVLIIDVRFNEDSRSGLEACERILREYKDARIVVFSQFDDPWLVEKAYEIGVYAFVRKDEESSTLLEAIQAASNKKTYFSPAIAQTIAKNTIKQPNPWSILDNKEKKIFILVAEGRTVNEISIEMDLSYKTVANSVKSIKEKIGISSHADFTKLAIKYGLISLEPE